MKRRFFVALRMTILAAAVMIGSQQRASAQFATFDASNLAQAVLLIGALVWIPANTHLVAICKIGDRLELRCENIFVKDDVLFLLVSLRNDSAVSYSVSSPRFAVESKRRTKRELQYEKAVFPKQSYGLGGVQPEDVGKRVFTFEKIAPTRGRVLRRVASGTS